jgi:hypothetical protein
MNMQRLRLSSPYSLHFSVIFWKPIAGLLGRQEKILSGHFLTVLLFRRDYWTVDVPVANAVRECVDPGTNQALRVFAVEDVRNHPESSLVRLVDDGAINFGSQLLVLAIPCVDADLDDVELVRRELLDRLAAFRAGRNPLRHCCASGSGMVMLRPALRNRAAPGIVWPRMSRNS